MLYRCPYEDVLVCSKVGWLAHPVPGHGKKSGYAPDHLTFQISFKLHRAFPGYEPSKMGLVSSVFFFFSSKCESCYKTQMNYPIALKFGIYTERRDESAS